MTDSRLLTVLLIWAMGVSVLFCCCYVRGLLRLRRHPQGRRQRWRPLAFALAVATVLVVSLPPLGERLEQRLSTHMVQHVCFIMVAAPLFALATPGHAVLAGLPTAVRRRLVRLTRRLPGTVLLAPHLAWVVHIVTLWLWHLPAPYDAAVRSDTVHLLEHATFLGTAWLFWWHLATVSRRRLRGPGALLYVAAAVPPGAALGAVLTFPDQVLYPAQAARAAATGVNPLLDQRIGGLVMWIPLDLVYLLVAILLFAHWFRRLGVAWPAPPVDAGEPEPDPLHAPAGGV